MDDLINGNDNQLNLFLFFVIFGKTKQEYDALEIDKKIQVCAERAYLEFCRTITIFIHTDPGTGRKYKDNEWKKMVENLKNLYYRGNTHFSGIIESIKQLINAESQDNYDSLHEELCLSITGVKDETILCGSLSVGQAQKWVNMIMKYLWLTGCVSDGYKFLHVPIDNYTLKALADGNTSTSIKKNGNQYMVKCKDQFVPWSRITDYDDCYKLIQEEFNNYASISGFSSPIEWEFNAWLSIAENK